MVPRSTAASAEGCRKRWSLPCPALTPNGANGNGATALQIQTLAATTASRSITRTRDHSRAIWNPNPAASTNRFRPTTIPPMHITYETVDQEQTPFGELVLRRYRASTGEVGYEILLDGSFLMASHGCHSERAMASLAHSRLVTPASDLTVLVGGLGAGHTLRAVLDLPSVARVVVADIGARVAEWNRTYFANVNEGAVDDPRVEVRVGDLLAELRHHRGAFVLMILDVDNGPGWLASPANAPLYRAEGLGACRGALGPGGVMAVWSPLGNPSFEQALDAAFPWTEAVDTTALGRAEGEPGSVIYLAGFESP